MHFPSGKINPSDVAGVSHQHRLPVWGHRDSSGTLKGGSRAYPVCIAVLPSARKGAYGARCDVNQADSSIGSISHEQFLFVWRQGYLSGSVEDGIRAGAVLPTRGSRPREGMMMSRGDVQNLDPVISCVTHESYAIRRECNVTRVVEAGSERSAEITCGNVHDTYPLIETIYHEQRPTVVCHRRSARFIKCCNGADSVTESLVRRSRKRTYTPW